MLSQLPQQNTESSAGERRLRSNSTISRLVFLLSIMGVLISLASLHLQERESYTASMSLSRLATEAPPQPQQPYKNPFLLQNYDPLGLLQDHTPQIARLWACATEAPLHKKLVFVHVFKTAGSTFRYFFDHYGDWCKRGVAVVTECSTMTKQSLTQGVWGDAQDAGCNIKAAWNRNHEQVAANLKRNATHGFMEDNGVDVMIGHLPIGIDQGWQEGGRPVEAQYVTFFRDPFDKFVSSRVYVNKHKQWSHEEALEQIKQQTRERYKTSRNNHSHGEFYEGYSKYLLTPEQKETRPNPEQKVELVMQNLIDKNVLVGVVERMGDSLALLGHVIDGDNELDDILALMDPSLEANQVKGAVSAIRNQSKLSTSALVADLRKDEAFMEILADYLRLEFRLYSFALQLHERQVESLR